jgi:voltage-gated potassium channel
VSVRARIHAILEVAAPGDTASRAFDVVLLVAIALNVAAAVLGSDPDVYATAPGLFDWVENTSLVLFTVEYGLRLWACTAAPRFSAPVRGRLAYALQPMLLVDLVAILPFVLQIAGYDTRMLRAVRLLRVFRVVRLLRYAESMQALGRVLLRKRGELTTLAFGLAILLLLIASLVYFAEHNVPGTPFRSIPAAMWWGITTLTTVGYGDMVPATTVGRFLAGCTAVLGIGMFALPTSIIGAAFIDEMQERRRQREAVAGDRCPTCGRSR